MKNWKVSKCIMEKVSQTPNVSRTRVDQKVPQNCKYNISVNVDEELGGGLSNA